jgi:hypothetical protein
MSVSYLSIEEITHKVNDLLKNATQAIAPLVEKRRNLVARDLKNREILKGYYEKHIAKILADLLKELEKGGIDTAFNIKQITIKEFLSRTNALDDDDHKYLLFEYVYWSFAKASLWGSLKDKSWMKQSSRYSKNFICEVCNSEETYLLGRAYRKQISEKCNHCGHLSGGYCSCEYCRTVDSNIVSKLKEVRSKLIDLIDDNIETIDRLFLERYTPADIPPEEIMITDQMANHSKLDSDERMFINAVNKVKIVNPDANPKMVFDNLSEGFKATPRSVLIKLCKHKVFYRCKIYPSITTDMVMRKILFDFQFDCLRRTDSHILYGRFDWNYLDEDSSKLQFNWIRFSPLGDVIPLNGNVDCDGKYIFNPYYLVGFEQQSNVPSKSRQGDVNFKTNLFRSLHEKEYYTQLKLKYGGMIIIPNYPIRLFVELNKLNGEFEKKEIAYLSNAYVDFAIFDKDGSIQCVYEAQITKHHNDKTQVRRDYLKIKLFEFVGIEFHELHGKFHPSFMN